MRGYEGLHPIKAARYQRILDRMGGYADALMASGGDIEVVPPREYGRADVTAKGFRRCPLFVAACVLGEPSQIVSLVAGGYRPAADADFCPLAYVSRRLATARRRMREGKPPEVFNENLGQEFNYEACEVLRVALAELRHWVRVAGV